MLDALGINLPGLLTQIVSFLVLFGVLRLLLYKPILRMLDQRSNRIKEGLQAADQARADGARSQEDMQQQHSEVRAEGQAMLAQARETADRFREEELRRAREDIQAERARAEINIHRERDAAIEELRREFAGLAILAAERVIERSLDPESHRELIEKVLEESAQVGGN